MLDFSRYANKKICVAVSGGKDSIALLHMLTSCAEKYSITVTALNCDHGIRGEASVRDSEFVKNYCTAHNIPLLTFKANGFDSEVKARIWRLQCYKKATIPHVTESGESWQGADAVATAHHLNDNAETVLFNMARGSSLSGVTGISDGKARVQTDDGFTTVELVRPIITLSREEIDEYIEKNSLPFVTDESNFTDDYTRNYIRHNVLPELEKAVSGAVRSIYRFCENARSDEQFFFDLIDELALVSYTKTSARIKLNDKYPLFSRAVVKALKEKFDKKDYTREQVDALFALQEKAVGAKFEFLNLIAYRESDGIALAPRLENSAKEIPLCELEKSSYPQYMAEITDICRENSLRFDRDKLPENAVVRTRKSGDVFEKFGGGSKKLGDYLTDKKIPLRLRDSLPLVAVGNEVLLIFGVEISEKIKIDENTKHIAYAVCDDIKNV